LCCTLVALAVRNGQDQSARRPVCPDTRRALARAAPLGSPHGVAGRAEGKKESRRRCSVPTIEFFDRGAVPPPPDSPTTAAPLTRDHKSDARRAYREARAAITLLQQRWPAAFPEEPQQVRPLAAGELQRA
jgi:hypothetical protein